ncbi:MAG: RpiB/LacA/LacB family sugar-phosphate isomerase [Candidatus Moraniibacteriota bacterium]|jgi:ribose 5-phosphate isomerase B
MKIYLGTDHAGYDLKEQLKIFLTEELNFEVVDFGADSFDKNDDYPDFIKPVAEVVADSENLGIILGGSGQGEAIVANRTSGIRCAVYYGGPKEIITLSKEHNNANVLSLGARFLSIEDAKDSVKLWLETKFSEEERHVRRIAKIDNY